jgi:DNA-binding IclR family transcriptional regulator
MAINGARDQLSKASAILELLATSAASKPWWGVREIAKSLGASTTTTHRTLVALSDIGYVRQDPESGRYAIGTELRRVASLITNSDPFVELARPTLQLLTKDTGETSILARFDEITRSLVFVDVVHGRRELGYDIPIHRHLSLYRGASGLAVLANMSAGCPETHPELRALLHGIRSTGVALTQGERIPGALGLSSAVLTDSGTVVGSVTLTIPEARMPTPESRRKMALRVREAAAQISKRIKSSNVTS